MNNKSPEYKETANGYFYMKKFIKSFGVAIFVLATGFSITACDLFGNRNDSSENDDLSKYQQLGMSIAAKPYDINTYNCENYTTQFYKKCYENNMPCRIRSGKAGGTGFSDGAHAWNSVKINGRWVDWEPQSNNVHTGHIKGNTPGNQHLQAFSYCLEDLTRILYELVGRRVPNNVLDYGNIHDGLNAGAYGKGRFNAYLGGLCITDNQSSVILRYNLGSFQSQLQNDGDGGCYTITDANNLPVMITWVYKMGGKHYGVENLHLNINDPTEGRNIINQTTGIDFTGPFEYTLIDIPVQKR